MSGSYFRPRRNVQRSVIGHLTTQINNSWSNVNVVQSFSQVVSVSLPAVCIELDETYSSRLEIGSNTRLYEYMIIINIFAKSDAQRMDLADFVLSQMEEGCIYYEYTQDADYDISGSANGRIALVSVDTDDKVDIDDSSNSKEKYRHLLVLVVKRS